ncbi:hypothetical protein GCM10012275_55680 [Longimycelium tulufanense]|uniref:Uncharacterized protein n=1 Tax=Longimycelium tulufanense TaxID=907463 RepID=A0A8J3CJR9_9PSEU|nr:hypothetical protein GCM10012275_55680 [Longimycelium tulufanense]
MAERRRIYGQAQEMISRCAGWWWPSYRHSPSFTPAGSRARRVTAGLLYRAVESSEVLGPGWRSEGPTSSSVQPHCAGGEANAENRKAIRSPDAATCRAPGGAASPGRTAPRLTEEQHNVVNPPWRDRIAVLPGAGRGKGR